MPEFLYQIAHSATAAQGNVFFALQPDNRAKDAIVSLAQATRSTHRLNGTVFPARRLHVSLYKVGECRSLPTDIVHHARIAAANAAAFSKVFEVRFDRVRTHNTKEDRKPVILDSPHPQTAITALRHALGSALTHCDRPFHPLAELIPPHVTMLYDRIIVLEESTPPVSWQATELVLIDSLTGRSTYRELGRWPFTGD